MSYFSNVLIICKLNLIVLIVALSIKILFIYLLSETFVNAFKFSLKHVLRGKDQL